jgi:6-pyruvoyltetrahydropterin/6-carboxytetrahydropterin synthase
MEVTVRVEWDMGHRLPNHDGACRNLHGHRYVADITLRGPVLPSKSGSQEGMVADFGAVKALVRAEVAKLDHRFLVCDRDCYVDVLCQLPGVVLVPYAPTAENVAEALRRDISKSLNAAILARSEVHSGPLENMLVHVARVRLYETPTAWVDAQTPDGEFLL